MSITMPMEMVLAANDIYKVKNRSDRVQITTVSDRSTPIKTRSGITITPDKTLHELVRNSSQDNEKPIIFLPAMWRNPKDSLIEHADIISWLRDEVDNGAIVCAAGTGTYYLANTGHLYGKPATTHWYYFDNFSKIYPGVSLKRQHLITQAGNLYCAGSVNALADLTVHIIAKVFGSRISAHVEHQFSQEVRRPFENISFLDDRPTRHHDEEIIQVQLWLTQNFNKDIQLYDISKEFGMSTRSFNRRFKAATGKNPLRYLQELRISEARELLKSSNLSINEIGAKVGYHDTAHFSALFRKMTQITPGNFRKSVRGKLFSVEAL